jgi:alpha-tubulin suppressor-like RCC1 family protein
MPLLDTRQRRPAGHRRPVGLLAAGLCALLAAIPAAASAHARPAASVAAAKGGDAVAAWGRNFFGQLGNGTTTDASKPVYVQFPAPARFTTVRTGVTSVALTTTGRVYGWANNTYGQIGDGSTVSPLEPVRATALNDMKVTALRGGSSFTLALTSGGKVLAWGRNGDGELGNGTTTGSPDPVRVKIPKGVTVTAIAAGFASALALTKSGRVLAWGLNDAGQLGDGTAKERHTPGYVRLPAHTKITSIAAGDQAGYAVASTGRLLSWGINMTGGLGDGTTKKRLKPVQVHLPKGVKVVAATAGTLHALALTTTGRVLAWGFDPFGQIGNAPASAPATNFRLPRWVRLPNGAKARALAAGADFAVALTTGGRIFAWGRNKFGQLGNGTTTSSTTTPVRVQLPPSFKPTGIGAGWEAETALAIGNAPLS